jgi:hypothetical protein
LIGLRDFTLIQQKVIELQGEILSAPIERTFCPAKLLKRERALEKEVADLKGWDAEKQNYQLTNIR